MEAPYRKPVGRNDPGAPFSGGGGDSLKRNSSKKKNPPVTACGGDSPLWQGGLWSGTGAFKHPSPPC